MENVVEKEWDLLEVIDVLWQAKLKLAIASLVTAMVAVIFSLTVPNMYRSSAVIQLVKADDSVNGLQGMASQLGGLAGLAGINLNSADNESDLALEYIKTRKFVLEFVSTNNLSELLVATNGWNRATNEISYDNDIYDVETQKWKIEGDDGQVRPPSNDEVYKAFMKALSINKSVDTGLVTISLSHVSPIISKEWLDTLIKKINNEMKARFLTESSAKIAYLKEQIELTQIATLQGIFYQIIESEYQNRMLAETKSEFVFKTIDPAFIPEEKFAPKRAVMALIGMLIGLLLMSAFVLIREMLSNRGNT